MQDITIRFLDGPMRGQKLQREVGDVILGRQPPNEEDVELKGANTSVSRLHAHLLERDGAVIVKNVSPNGTTVDGKLIVDEVAIRTGAVIQIGDQYRFDVSWQSFGAEPRAPGKKSKKSGTAKKGAMASPIVRAVLFVYLGGIAALGIWFAVSGDTGPAADDWPGLLASYEAWQDAEVPADVWDEREARAQLLVRELRVLKTQGRPAATNRLCRELMSIDGDSGSPLYRYGARCLTTP